MDRALNVTASTNSGIAFNNTDTVNRSLTISGTNPFTIGTGANLTVSTISANTAQDNLINITRSITGAGSMIVEGFNNINSTTTNFGRGRVAMNNISPLLWTGALDIRKGTAEIYGAPATLDDFTGNISLGETGNAFGAGLLISPNANANLTFANAITVRSGGYRTIRSVVDPYSPGGDTFHTLSGPITLDGNLGLFINANNPDRRLIVSGNISGVGSLELTKGYANGFFRLQGNNSNWSGNLTISKGNRRYSR